MTRTGAEGYLVEVKPSARRTNAAVGRTVNREGPRHAFDDRAAAERWAETLSEGGPLVWIRTANPGDDAVDGYLMGRRRNAAIQDSAETARPGRQAEVGAYD